MLGTPEYLSPEAFLGHGVDTQSDVWALGILLYEMLVGYPPFEGNDPLDLYKKIVQHDLAFPTRFGPQAIELIKGLCAFSPTERVVR